jgi:ABC-2 type transport system permease protein
MFASLLKKEITEQVRNYKLLISGLLFLFFAILSPVTAKYLPEIIAGLGNIPGMTLDLPEPTYLDSIGQYVKNLSQIVLFVLIFLTMGIVAVEKDKGTAAFILVKPVPRHQFILAKVAVMWLNVTACLIAGAAVCYVYTLILFGSFPVVPFVSANIALLVFLLTIVTITVFFSTVFTSQVVAGICALLAWIALSALGSLGEIGNFAPSGLTTAALKFFVDGQSGWQHAWKALLGAGVLISAAIGGSIAYFRSWEP